MCALENLRVWEDPENGAVVALIHFSASFREGYLAFYINSRDSPIKVTDAGAREVKVRGLRVPVAEAGRAIRKDSAVDTDVDGSEADTRVGNANTGVEPAYAPVTDTANSANHAQGNGPKKAKGRKDVDRKKVISGARIEFASDAEKREFLELVAEYQRPERRVCVPDLLGID